MTSTLNTQAKKVQSATRGGWVKMLGDYHTNAFSAQHINGGIGTFSDYGLTVTKQDGRWYVYGEDHDIEEMVELGVQSEDGFRTLAEAKAAAEEFGETFERLWLENNAA